LGSERTAILLATTAPVSTLNFVTRKPISAGWLFASTSAM